MAYGKQAARSHRLATDGSGSLEHDFSPTSNTTRPCPKKPSREPPARCATWLPAGKRESVPGRSGHGLHARRDTGRSLPLPALRCQSRNVTSQHRERSANLPQKKISIRIDGELVNALEGQTILEAATRQRQVHSHPLLPGRADAGGACRLCMVEVPGIDRLLPACTTPMQDGMSVTTNSPKLIEVPPHVDRTAAGGAQSRLRRVRFQWPLRIAGDGHRLGITTCALCLQLSQACRWTCRIRASCSTTIAASCAPAACACAPKSKARTCGRSTSRGIHARIVSDLNQKWGDVTHLHQLRQVRAGMSDRSAVRKRQGGGGDGEEQCKRQLLWYAQRGAGMKKVKVATVWLDGCSGCHMSLLDMDAAIIPHRSQD